MSQMYFKNGSSWVNAVDIFWPVGAIYMSQNTTSPASLFGGSWQQMADVFPRFEWSPGGKGGEDQHLLTEFEMPGHSHRLKIKESWSEASGYGLWNPPNGFINRVIVSNGANGAWGSFNSDSQYREWVGGSASHNNIPYYLGCCAWYRVS